ncbi:hypothetical protein ATEIFO6365_0004024900 [Aspergillus terreus]|uniref:Uncharacterized protein n=1 Tax=Aspergillus terreus TaxID=33178 RepID=A0A5M3YQ47_ASPTE|nr:hypothetical protein ATETN484_0002027400 [Aspergillus terreus]GFF15130.1 hypothetical protein ATEIFO6365_0004024900 [Aspergillus terreus]
MKLLPFASLLALAAASPAERRQSSDAFSLNIRWSNSPLSGSLNANGGSFWTGKPTSSYCPDTVPQCKTVNATSFTVQDDKVFLNAAVPGGQQVYVSPQGQLTYTQPHSAYIPTGSLTSLASWSAASGASFLNPFLTFWLCNTEAHPNAWSVWLEYTNGTTGSITNNGSNGSNACTRIALEAKPYKGDAAWEFA